MVDVAVGAATDALEDAYSAGEVQAESEEDIGECMFQVGNTTFNGAPSDKCLRVAFQVTLAEGSREVELSLL